MPKLTSSEADDASGAARHELKMVVMEVLRALTRRDFDGISGVTEHFNILAQIMMGTYIFKEKPSAPPDVLIHQVIESFRESLAKRHYFENEMRDVVAASLRVAVEAMASDPSAQGRFHKRVNDLESSIKRLMARRPHNL